MLWLLLVIGFVVVIFVLANGKSKPKKGGASAIPLGSIKTRRFLTKSESSFLTLLEQSCPHLRFHCQVSMGALLSPKVSRAEDSKLYYSIRGAFSQKVVDYVAQDRLTGAVTALIELDDKTHDVDKDAKRDSLSSQAGYKTLRFNVSDLPTQEQLLAKFQDLATVSA